MAKPEQTRRDDVAGGLNLQPRLVGEQMTRAVISARPNSTLDEVARTMRSNHLRAIPVLTAEGKLLGAISEIDLRRATGRGDAALGHRGGEVWHRTCTAAELMTPSVPSIAPTTSVTEAARVMSDRRLCWLAVVDDGRLVGILERSDLSELIPPDAPAASEHATTRGFVSGHPR